MTFDTGLDSIRCPVCGLVQFCTLITICKRCRSSLGIHYATLNLSRENLEKDNSSEELIGAFGQVLRRARHARNLTQAECAVRLHTSRSQLSRLETGRHSPSFSMLIRSALVFSVDRVIHRMRIRSKCPSKS
jgi:ribosome-binding protein aMBF1 (putative translation factor)